MIRRSITRVLALLILLSLAVATPVIAQDSTVASMQAEDIGLPDDVTDIVPVSITGNGEVIVSGSTDDGPVSLVFRDGTFERIGGDDALSTAAAANASGQIAGWAESNGKVSAVLIENDNVVFMPGDYVSSRARAINVEGTLAGEAVIDAEMKNSVPVYWTESAIEILPSLGSGTAGAVLDMNTIEQMVGWSAIDDDAVERHATLWENGEATDIGTLGGALSEARGINETGLIVGASTTESGQEGLAAPGSSAFSWFDGQLTGLGTGEGHLWAAANDVNDVGMIVGIAGLDAPGSAGNETVAILWSGTEVLDLNDIVSAPEGLVLVEAVSVNELGQILCRGMDADGNARIAVLSVLGN